MDIRNKNKTIHISDIFPSGRDLFRIIHHHTSVLNQLCASVIEMQLAINATSNPLTGSTLPYDIHQTVLDTRIAASLLCKNAVRIISLCAGVARVAKYNLRSNPTIAFRRETMTVDELHHHLSRQRDRISGFSASWNKAYTNFRELVIVVEPSTSSPVGDSQPWFPSVVGLVKQWVYLPARQIVDPAIETKQLLLEAASPVDGSLEDLRASFEDLETYWQGWARGLTLQPPSSLLDLDLDWVAQEWMVEGELQGLKTPLLQDSS